MSITIKRNTGWIGSFTKIQIKVNGQQVASVMENQQIELELPNDKANIKAAQFGTKSNEIEVQDGDILEITTTKWHRMSIYILMVAFPLTSFIPDLTYRIIALISLFALSIIGLLVDGFYLKILDREQ